MLKRELKVNFKNFIIWLLLLFGIFGVVFCIYPSISNSENIKMMNEFIKVFPEEMLKAFNMDITSIENAYGWLKTEGFVFILLITGCYASILGSNILLKEESDKTIEYLNSLPIKRTSIVWKKVLVGVFYIVLMVLCLSFFNFIGLSFSGEFHKKQYFLLSLTPLLSSLVLYFMTLFLSTFFHKTKKMLGISLGVVFMSYILHMLSTISKEVEFLKYFSIFTLADIRNVILKVEMNPMMIFISIFLCVFFLFLTLFHYRKKELIS